MIQGWPTPTQTNLSRASSHVVEGGSFPHPLLREVERLGTECEKWDDLTEVFGRPDLLSMWVADMDFAAPQVVLDALGRRVAHGAFGYQMVPHGWKEAIVQWEASRHGHVIDPAWIRYVPGIVPALFWLVDLLTAPDEACLIQTPVYYPFRSAVEKNGRRLVTHDLVNEGGRYRMDFEGLEAAIRTQQVRLFILCSPHNPVGRVWTREELCRMLEICDAYDVCILSDEIHRDLVMGPRPHVPTASLASSHSRLITLASASKSFNLASLSNAFVLIPDAGVRTRFDAAVSRANHGEGNTLGYVATEAAFREGGPWLDALTEQVRGNAATLRDRFARDLPEAILSPLEGTYLQWVDLRGLVPESELEGFMRDVCRVAVNLGDWFGTAGKGFIRLNLATPRWRVAQVADRMVAGAKLVRGSRQDAAGTSTR